MKKIVIASGYGIASLGDEALLHALVNGITSRLGSIALTIISRQAMLPFFDDENARLWSDVADRMKLSRDGLVRRLTTPGVEIGDIVEGGMNWRDRADNNLWPAIEAADLVIVGGGGLFHDTNSRFIYGPLTVYPGLITAAKAMGKPVVVAGVSVGPLASGWGRAVVRAALQGIPVIVRDRPSQSLLRELGIESEVLPDLSLALDPLPVELPMAGQLLGVAPIWLDSFADWLPDFIKGLQMVMRGTGLTPALIPHCTYQRYPIDDDTNICNSIIPFLTAHSGAPMLVQEDPYDPETALGVYGCFAAAVTIRMHGAAFAARMGVPFTSLAYWPKVGGFCEWYGKPVYPLEGLDWVHAFLEQWEHRDEEATRIRARTEELRALLPRYWDVIEEAIGG